MSNTVETNSANGPKQTDVLFAYDTPQSMTKPQIEVLGILKGLIESSGIKHTEASNEKGILMFARED